jgi:hypothetical protein
VDTAQVVYLSGDDVVLKDGSGRLRLLALPKGTPLIVDLSREKGSLRELGLACSSPKLCQCQRRLSPRSCNGVYFMAIP